MAYGRSIIQLKPDFDVMDLVNISLQQAYVDRTVKPEVPTMDGASIEEIIYCLREFHEASTALEFNTGDELFTNFRHTLQSAAKVDWDIVIKNIPNRTPSIFYAAIEAWKNELILPSACQTMVDYLETLNKPHNMTVEAFVNCVKVMVRYITNIPFPGPDLPLISQTKLKNIILRAMPTTWQTNFL
jgi:hypothetical protein